MTMPSIETYPYKERLPPAAVMLCFLAFDCYGSRRFFRITDWVSMGAMVLLCLCKPKGQLFWFFAGIAAVAFLVGLLSLFHVKYGVLYDGMLIGFPAFAVGIVVWMRMRGQRRASQ